MFFDNKHGLHVRHTFFALAVCGCTQTFFLVVREQSTTTTWASSRRKTWRIGWSSLTGEQYQLLVSTTKQQDAWNNQFYKIWPLCNFYWNFFFFFFFFFCDTITHDTLALCTLAYFYSRRRNRRVLLESLTWFCRDAAGGRLEATEPWVRLPEDDGGGGAEEEPPRAGATRHLGICRRERPQWWVLVFFFCFVLFCFVFLHWNNSRLVDSFLIDLPLCPAVDDVDSIRDQEARDELLKIREENAQPQQAHSFRRNYRVRSGAAKDQHMEHTEL